MENEFLGTGEDGERVFGEQTQEGYLIHCEGNTESPFFFQLHEDAMFFAQLIAKKERKERDENN